MSLSIAARLAATPEAAHVVPGRELSVVLTLGNDGNVVDYYHVTVHGVSGEWYKLERPGIALFPGEQERLRLSIHPPEDAWVGSRHRLTIRLTSDSDPNVTVSVPLTLTVSDGAALHMDVNAAEGGDSGRFDVTIVNLLTGPSVVVVEARGPHDALRITVTPQGPIMVPGGGTNRASLRVAPRKPRRFGEPRAYDVEVRGTLPGQDAGAKPNLAQTIRYTYTPPHGALRFRLTHLPAWLVIVPAILLLGGAVAYSQVIRPAARHTATPPSALTPRGAVKAAVRHRAEPAPTSSPTAAPTSSPTVAPTSSPTVAPTSGGPIGAQASPVATASTVASAVPTGAAFLNPDTLHFGSVHRGKTATRTIHVFNLGPSAIRLQRPAVTGRNRSEFKARTSCPRTLPVDAGCIITVRFKPSRIGRRQATLVVGGPSGGVHTVPLRGTGRA